MWRQSSGRVSIRRWADSLRGASGISVTRMSRHALAVTPAELAFLGTACRLKIQAGGDLQLVQQPPGLLGLEGFLLADHAIDPESDRGALAPGIDVNVSRTLTNSVGEDAGEQLG